MTSKNGNLTYLNFYDSNGRSEVDLKVHFTEGEYSGDAPPVSGQPLPGTLASLLISSATIGILLLRKKRQALRAAIEGLVAVGAIGILDVEADLLVVLEQ